MATGIDRLKGGLTVLIRKTLGAWIVTRVDYLALYPCRVVVQNGDDTLELVADDERVGTLSHVPIRYGIPGVKATVSSGSRCYVTWAAGDPRKAIVVDWESGTAVIVNVDAATVNLNGSTMVNIGQGADAKLVRFEDLKIAYDPHVHLGNLGFPTGNPLVPLPPSVGASKGSVK